MSRLTILILCGMTLFFSIITVALILLAVTSGKLDYLLSAFINLLIVTGGIYLLVYKV